MSLAQASLERVIPIYDLEVKILYSRISSHLRKGKSYAAEFIS
jgi:hypothetical protein